VKPEDSRGAIAVHLSEYLPIGEGFQHTLQVTDDLWVAMTMLQLRTSVQTTMSDDVTFSEDQLVGLTPEQREAVTSTQRQLLVRATAGSGKTHVLTLRIQRRIADGDIAPDQVLAMTFTRKAADELRTRLWRAGIRGVAAGTFHRAALDIVSDFRTDNNLKPMSIEPNRRRLVNELVVTLNKTGQRIEEWQIPRIEQEIGWALSQGFNGTTYGRRASRARRAAPLPGAQMADLIDRYVGLCQSKGVVDFDLLLSEAIRILRDDRAALASFRHRHRALFVDEAQDINPLQFTLLRLMAGDDPDIFTVGDPNQSIYGFNGASPQLLQELLATWPDTVVLDLTRNHRSTAHIVSVADTLLEAGAAGITPAKADGEIPLVRTYDTDELEARAVATWLTSRHQPGSPWRSMAVLARTNNQLNIMGEVLTAMHIPFERRGAENSPGSDVIVGDTGPARWFDQDHKDAVSLSTIHRSKGLEWQHVAVIGLAEGILPNFNATTAEDIAEEQRLAYVALTRAEETLLLTWNRGRHDPRTPDRQPSRFLAAITQKISELAAVEAPLLGDERRQRLAAIREQLAASRPQLSSDGSEHVPS